MYRYSLIDWSASNYQLLKNNDKVLINLSGAKGHNDNVDDVAIN